MNVILAFKCTNATCYLWMHSRSHLHQVCQDSRNMHACLCCWCILWLFAAYIPTCDSAVVCQSKGVLPLAAGQASWTCALELSRLELCLTALSGETVKRYSGEYSGESAHLPPMCPGFDSRTWRHMHTWVCWFSTLLREVFLLVLWFSPLLKN